METLNLKGSFRGTTPVLGNLYTYVLYTSDFRPFLNEKKTQRILRIELFETVMALQQKDRNIITGTFISLIIV